MIESQCSYTVCPVEGVSKALYELLEKSVDHSSGRAGPIFDGHDVRTDIANPNSNLAVGVKEQGLEQEVSELLKHLGSDDDLQIIV